MRSDLLKADRLKGGGIKPAPRATHRTPDHFDASRRCFKALLIHVQAAVRVQVRTRGSPPHRFDAKWLSPRLHCRPRESSSILLTGADLKSGSQSPIRFKNSTMRRYAVLTMRLGAK